MKVNVLQNELANVVKIVKNGCEKAKILPVLQTIKIEAKDNKLFLTATNNINCIKATIDAEVEQEGSLCVNAQKLDDIISRLSDNILLIKEDKLTIKSKKSKFQLSYIDDKEFPIIPQRDFVENIVLDFKEFKNAIKSTIFTCVKENHSIYDSINLKIENNIIEFASTDGNRLCFVEIPCNVEKNVNVIIPNAILNEIIKIECENINIKFSDKVISFECGNIVYDTLLKAGQFPPVRRLIPKNTKVATINKNEFLKAIDRVSLFADEKIKRIKMCFENDTLRLECKNNDGVGVEEIGIDYNSEDIKIFFDYKFILDALRNCENDEIKIYLEHTLSATLFDLGFAYVVMPLQVGVEC